MERIAPCGCGKRQCPHCREARQRNLRRANKQRYRAGLRKRLAARVGLYPVDARYVKELLKDLGK